MNSLKTQECPYYKVTHPHNITYAIYNNKSMKHINSNVYKVGINNGILLYVQSYQISTMNYVPIGFTTFRCHMA